jgi:hypothetical protein
MNPNDDHDLSQLLRKWESDVEVPSRFRSSVLSQIAGREEQRHQSFGERLNAFFARPVYACAVATLALAASIGLAEIHVNRVMTKRQSVAAASYMASISALVRVSSNPHGHE